MAFKAAKCPNCAGELQVPEERNTVKCMYCGSDIIVREAINLVGGINIENLLMLAKMAEDNRDTEDAGKYYSNVLEYDSQNVLAWMGLGRIGKRDPKKCFTYALTFAGDKEKVKSDIIKFCEREAQYNLDGNTWVNISRSIYGTPDKNPYINFLIEVDPNNIIGLMARGAIENYEKALVLSNHDKAIKEKIVQILLYRLNVSDDIHGLELFGHFRALMVAHPEKREYCRERVKDIIRLIEYFDKLTEDKLTGNCEHMVFLFKRAFVHCLEEEFKVNAKENAEFKARWKHGFIEDRRWDPDQHRKLEDELHDVWWVSNDDEIFTFMRALREKYVDQINASSASKEEDLNELLKWAKNEEERADKSWKDAKVGALECFIATATFGSPTSPEVTVFRDFRDNYLVSTFLGKVLVYIYYWISPPISKLIDRFELLRRISKTFLKAIIYFLNIESIQDRNR